MTLLRPVPANRGSSKCFLLYSSVGQCLCKGWSNVRVCCSLIFVLLFQHVPLGFCFALMQTQIKGEAAWSPLSNTNTIARYSGIGEDTLASSLVASTNFTSPSGRLCAGFHIPDVDRLADRRSHQRSISPAQSHGISSMEVSSIGGPSERRENVAPDGRMGGMATIVGRTWWMERDPVSAVRRSREKQS